MLIINEHEGHAHLKPYFLTSDFLEILHCYNKSKNQWKSPNVTSTSDLNITFFSRNLYKKYMSRLTFF